jgi:hypothetical protein
MVACDQKATRMCLEKVWVRTAGSLYQGPPARWVLADHAGGGLNGPLVICVPLAATAVPYHVRLLSESADFHSESAERALERALQVGSSCGHWQPGPGQAAPTAGPAEASPGPRRARVEWWVIDCVQHLPSDSETGDADGPRIRPEGWQAVATATRTCLIDSSYTAGGMGECRLERPGERERRGA